MHIRIIALKSPNIVSVGERIRNLMSSAKMCKRFDRLIFTKWSVVVCINLNKEIVKQTILELRIILQIRNYKSCDYNPLSNKTVYKTRVFWKHFIHSFINVLSPQLYNSYLASSFPLSSDKLIQMIRKFHIWERRHRSSSRRSIT